MTHPYADCPKCGKPLYGEHVCFPSPQGQPVTADDIAWLRGVFANCAASGKSEAHARRILDVLDAARSAAPATENTSAD